MSKYHKDKRYLKRQHRRYSDTALGTNGSWNSSPSINDEKDLYSARAEADVEIEDDAERRFEELAEQYSLLEKLWKNRDSRKNKRTVRRDHGY